jgi:hypothetical protein
MLTNARRFLAQLRSHQTGGALVGDGPAAQRRHALLLAALCLLATITVAQLLAPSTARSATETFTASADTYSTERSPDLVPGGYDFLKVKGEPLRSSYLRFDVDRAIPNVKRATLRVYSTERNDWRVDVRYVADSGWDENGLTFANAPWTGPIVGHAPVITARGWVEVDVTDVLQHDSVISHDARAHHVARRVHR